MNELVFPLIAISVILITYFGPAIISLFKKETE
jgi:hypothetical protein